MDRATATPLDHTPKFDTAGSHEFIGWFDENGTKYTFQGRTDPEITGDLDLFAHWKYNVTYDAKGGTPEPAAQTVEEGEYIDEPAKPTYGERDFKGWYDDAPTLFNRYMFKDGGPVTKDIHLTAKWDCSVVFDAGDGIFPAIAGDR